jgi:putative DNA primase/helicase
MPDGLNDRAADTWEPLIAIADLAGGDWPARARAAALALSGENSGKDDDIDTLLLSDIRDAFDHFGNDRLSSEDLIGYLAGLEARPWAEWSHGKPMSKFQLSKRLKNYAIVSGTIRTGKGNETPKGYYP